MGLRAIAAGVSLAVLVSTGCAGNPSPPEGDRRLSVGIGELTAESLVSGVDGYSWLIGSTHGANLGLYRFRGDRAERVADLSHFAQGVRASAFGELVVVGGVRCADAGCKSSVLELDAVDADNRVTSWGIVDSKVGAPDDTDTAFFLGTTASRLWTANLAGELLALDAEGAVVAGPIPPTVWTDPCVIGPDLYRVEAESPPPPPPPGVAEQVPFQPLGYRVSRWDGSQFVPVPDSQLSEAESPGVLAFCADAGFEIPGRGAIARWEPGREWQRTDLVSPPPSARSNLTQSSSHRWYVVDASGAVRRRSDAGWVATGLEFPLREGGSPPFVLAIDDANGQIVACLAPSQGLECRSTAT